MARPEPERVCLGVIGAPHGVRGEVRIRTFTEAPEDITAYGPLIDDVGRIWRLQVKGPYKSGVLATLDGIRDRTAAEGLRGRRLYVDRDVLPVISEEDTYYHADLIGLDVLLPSGVTVGTVVAVQDFGAGELLEIALGERRTVLVAFTAEAVPEVDLEAGRVVVAPREEFDAAPDGGER